MDDKPKTMPLKFNERVVGSAHVDRHGKATLFFSGKDGEDLYLKLFGDSTKGLSIEFDEVKPTDADKMAAEVNTFANKIASYVASHPDVQNWSRHRAMVEAITVLFNDIGAAQDFFTVFGLKIDLYTTDIDELNSYLEKKGE